MLCICNDLEIKMYTHENDVSTNLNIRISSNLKSFSSSLLQSMGVNQSQYIRDALQYVVNHNALPWQQSNANSILYKYTSHQGDLHAVINQISNGIPLQQLQFNDICAFLDDLHLHSARAQDSHLAQGVMSLPLSKLLGLFIQLTSLIRYNFSGFQGGAVYAPIVANQIKHTLEQIDVTIRSNNL